MTQWPRVQAMDSTRNQAVYPRDFTKVLQDPAEVQFTLVCDTVGLVRRRQENGLCPVCPGNSGLQIAVRWVSLAGFVSSIRPHCAARQSLDAVAHPLT